MSSIIVAEEYSPTPTRQKAQHTRSTARALLALIRPSHWLKNLVIVPLVVLTWPQWSTTTWTRLLWIVTVFTLAAICIYIFNDLADRDRDRGHPIKRLRPIAAGEVSVPLAWTFLSVMTVVLVTVAALGPVSRAWPVAVYIGMNLAYSRWLKHVPLIDVFIVATGFVLRLVAGVLAVNAALSGWLVLSVLSGCLLLGLGKRRHEMTVSTAGYNSTAHRPSLGAYTVQFLDYLVLLTAGLAVTSLMSYLSSEIVAAQFGRVPLVLSALPVLFATCRYLQLVFMHGGGGDPVHLIKDRPILLSVLCWGLCLAAAIVIPGGQ